MRRTTQILVAHWAFVAALGCGGKRIEIVLEPAGGCESECGHAPLGCVHTLQLDQYGGIGTFASAAGVVGPADTNENLCTNGFADALDTEIDADASELEIWGYAPPPPDNLLSLRPAPLFVARGPFDRDSNRAHLEARCALSCEAMHPWAHEKWIHDVRSGEIPDAVEVTAVGVGMAFDMRSFYPEQGEPDVRTAGFPVVAQRPRVEDGGVVLEGDVIDWPFELEHRCWAVFLANIDVGRQVICMGPEEPVVHLLSQIDGDFIWSWLEREDPDRPPIQGYFVGIVRNAANDEPLEGATVAAPPEVGALYPDFDLGWSPEAGARVSTGQLGVFVVRGPFVGEIAVERPGFHPTPLRVAVLPAFTGSRVVYLAPVE